MWKGWGGRFDGVVDDFDFLGIDAILFDELGFGFVADGDDFCGGVHSGAFDFQDAVVGIGTGTVDFGGVDLDDEGLSGISGDGHGGFEGHPVVGVDEVEGFGLGDGGGEPGVTFGFGEEVAGVTGIGLPEEGGLRVAGLVEIGSAAAARVGLRGFFGIVGRRSGLFDPLVSGGVEPFFPACNRVARTAFFDDHLLILCRGHVGFEAGVDREEGDAL